MRAENLANGDLIKDLVGGICTVVRNEDTGELYAVQISGFGPPDVKIVCLSDLGDNYIEREFKPVATAWQRENEQAAALKALEEREG